MKGFSRIDITDTNQKPKKMIGFSSVCYMSHSLLVKSSNNKNDFSIIKTKNKDCKCSFNCVPLVRDSLYKTLH